MSIPFGIKVELWTGEDFSGTRIGPYIGPVSLPEIDAGSNQPSSPEIKSMKIRKLPVKVEISEQDN